MDQVFLASLSSMSSSGKGVLLPPPGAATTQRALFIVPDSSNEFASPKRDTH